MEISRQLKWQREQAAKGMCNRCGKRKVEPGRRKCGECLDAISVSRRKRLGHQRWTRGKRGRPPWYADIGRKPITPKSNVRPSKTEA